MRSAGENSGTRSRGSARSMWFIGRSRSQTDLARILAGPSGIRLADTHCVRRLRPMNHIGLATFLVDCLAIRETERNNIASSRSKLR
jgi:hypothetical protein